MWLSLLLVFAISAFGILIKLSLLLFSGLTLPTPKLYLICLSKLLQERVVGIRGFRVLSKLSACKKKN
jgi:hypothetical protein